MEEQFKNIDRLTRKLVKEAGTYKPSPDFLHNVMTTVNAKVADQKVYQPLISKKVWRIISILAIISLIALYFYPATGNSYINEFNLAEKLSFNNPFTNPFAGITFSKTIIYGIGFLGLFLIQIPFLKSFMERRYQ